MQTYFIPRHSNIAAFPDPRAEMNCYFKRLYKIAGKILLWGVFRFLWNVCDGVLLRIFSKAKSYEQFLQEIPSLMFGRVLNTYPRIDRVLYIKAPEKDSRHEPKWILAFICSALRKTFMHYFQYCIIEHLNSLLPRRFCAMIQQRTTVVQMLKNSPEKDLYWKYLK